MTRRTAKRSSMPEPDGPAINRGEFVREIDRECRDHSRPPQAKRRKLYLDDALDHKWITGDQYAAGTRLQNDYEMGQKRGLSGKNGEKVNGSRSYDIPQAAIDADARFESAMAVLPVELVTITTLLLLPAKGPDHAFTLDQAAIASGVDKRAASLGISVALSLLARHYGVQFHGKHCEKR